MLKASFVIPSYNNSAWLPRAVRSVLEQTVKSECVVVDDGSTDSTKDYLAWLKENHPDVKVVRHDKSLGRSRARNAGNDIATGDVIFVLDSDDIAHPSRVEWTLPKFKKADYVYGSAVKVSVLGTRLGDIRADKFDLKRAVEEKVNRIVHSTAAYTKRFAKQFPYSDGEVAQLGIDDWDQQIRAAHAGAKFDYCPQAVAYYTILASSISNTRDEKKVLELKGKILAQFKEVAA